MDLDDRETGLVDRSLDAALLALQGLPFNQAGQLIHMPPWSGAASLARVS
jgi:hypothetical protein